MENAKDLRLAVLIDADNIPHRLVAGILKKLPNTAPTFKRIYADWTKPHVAGWKSVLLIVPYTGATIQLYNREEFFRLALIIDAMDILTPGGRWLRVISSDSDFAILLRMIARSRHESFR
jgi:hypothetical protein